MSNIIERDVNNLVDNIDFSQLRNKSILITGASGLIGCYLASCLKLVYKKYNIKVFLSHKNDLSHEFKEVFDFDYVDLQGDIMDISLDEKMDLIIHAAGYGQPGKFLDNKIKTIEINTTATINLFKQLKSNGKFLFVSTSELYSGNNANSITESEVGLTSTDHSRACYIESKKCGEAICYAYKELNYDVKIARLSLAYGPGTKKGDHRVLNAFIEKAIKENSINLLDEGQAIRTYCYITDVIEMFWNIMLNGKNTVYNVGGYSVTTILDLANTIGGMLNKEVFTPTKSKELKGSPKRVNISTELYKKEFNKNTFVSLNEGLKNTIEWQKLLYKN